MSTHRSSWAGLGLVLLSALLACASPSRSAPESVEARIEALERENTTLRMDIAAFLERLQHLEGGVRPYSGTNTTVCGPSIDAVVLDVDQGLRMVTLDKGRKDEVKVGYTFDVYLGRQYKGHVRVQDVQETTCTGIIVNESSPMAKGDSAATIL